MTAKTFHLGDILSVTTGRLVSPRRMGGVLDILTWMTGERPAAHQIPRVTRECRDPLLAQHPDLAAITRPTFTDPPGGRGAAVARWLAEQVAAYGETREVEPLDPADHTRIDPVTEALRCNPDMEVIIMETPEEL